MAELTLALFQHQSQPGDKAAQLNALRSAAAEASAAGAKLIVTPELFMAGYNIGAQALELAEAVDGPFLTDVSGIAQDKGVAILCAYAERDGDELFNSAALISADGARVFNFRKLHASGSYEKATYGCGDDVVTAEIDGVTIAPLICYDVEQPEAVRAAALAGADVVCVPTALRQQYAHLTETMIPTRAFENGCFVAYVNHAGSEGDYEYCGLSRLAAPDGSVVSAQGNAPELVIAQVETDRIASARAELPYLTDRRADLLGGRQRALPAVNQTT